MIFAFQNAVKTHMELIVPRVILYVAIVQAHRALTAFIAQEITLLAMHFTQRPTETAHALKVTTSILPQMRAKHAIHFAQIALVLLTENA